MLSSSDTPITTHRKKRSHPKKPKTSNWRPSQTSPSSKEYWLTSQTDSLLPYLPAAMLGRVCHRYCITLNVIVFIIITIVIIVVVIIIVIVIVVVVVIIIIIIIIIIVIIIVIIIIITTIIIDIISENIQQLIIDTVISWAKTDIIADQNLIRAMFSLLHRQYDGVSEVRFLMALTAVPSVHSIILVVVVIVTD